MTLVANRTIAFFDSQFERQTRLEISPSILLTKSPYPTFMAESWSWVAV
jgi:hypothetical protein